MCEGNARKPPSFFFSQIFWMLVALITVLLKGEKRSEDPRKSLGGNYCLVCVNKKAAFV
jgi:hypothetical protein